MWPAGQSRPLSAKHRLREYDSCCLRGTGEMPEWGAGLLVGHMVLTLSSAICVQKAA